MKIVNLSAETEQNKTIDTVTNNAVDKQKNQKVTNQDVAKDKQVSGKGVSLQISEEAMQKYLEKLNVQQQMDSIREQNEGSKEAIEDLGKIMLIFRRIADGDIVPPQDEKKLMEHSSEMYHAAKNLGMLAKNEEPEEYDSVDEGEKEEAKGNISSTSTGITMPAGSTKTEAPMGEICIEGEV